MHQLGPIKATMLQIGEIVQGNDKTWLREPKVGSRKRNVWDIEVQDNNKILTEMSTKWPRDRGICSR